MADNFRCPIKGEQFKRDYELVQATLKKDDIAMTTYYRSMIQKQAAKIRRDAK